MPSVIQTRASVRRFLNGLGAVDTEDDGNFSMRNGSARIFVSVEDFADDDTWVRITCPVLRDVQLTPSLFEWIALNAANYRYGTMSIELQEEGRGTILLTHGVLGTYIDPEELRIAVAMLADSADQIDDVLARVFGGVPFYETDR